MDTKEIREYNIFSAMRFASLIKSDFAIHKRNYIKVSMGFIGMFIAFAVITAITCYSMGGYQETIFPISEMEDDISLNNVQVCDIMYLLLSLWAISIGLTIFGSLTFSSMSSKRGRIATLMQPASMTEKFLLRFLIYFIGGIIILIVGFLLGTLVCQLAYNGGTKILKVIDFFFFSQMGAWPFTLLVVLATLLMDGIYTVGSSMWPKLSWIKTWVIVAVFEWIIGSFMISGILSPTNIQLFAKHVEAHIDTLWWIGISVLSLLIIGCWLIAWRRFRTSQIVQRFMSN